MGPLRPAISQLVSVDSRFLSVRAQGLSSFSVPAASEAMSETVPAGARTGYEETALPMSRLPLTGPQLPLHSNSTNIAGRVKPYIALKDSLHSTVTCGTPTSQEKPQLPTPSKKKDRRVQLNMTIQICEYFPLDAPDDIRLSENATDRLLSAHPDMHNQRPLGRLSLRKIEVTFGRDTAQDHKAVTTDTIPATPVQSPVAISE